MERGDTKIKIVIADDHAIVRQGIVNYLELKHDIQVVGQACDGLSAVKLAGELKPEIVIMDISLPNMNGIDASREITDSLPHTKIIALSMHASKEYVTEMFRAGANAYLLKESGFEELYNAIQTVINGKSYLSPSLVDLVVDNFIKPSPSEEASVFNKLSKRQREVLQLLAEGKTTKQVALNLKISPKTVEAHRLNLMEKLKIDNIAQLTKYAVQQGLTTLDPASGDSELQS